MGAGGAWGRTDQLLATQQRPKVGRRPWGEDGSRLQCLGSTEGSEAHTPGKTEGPAWTQRCSHPAGPALRLSSPPSPREDTGLPVPEPKVSSVRTLTTAS